MLSYILGTLSGLIFGLGTGTFIAAAILHTTYDVPLGTAWRSVWRILFRML